MGRNARETISQFVEQAFSALDQVDYYRVLGVSSACNQEQIREAYYLLASRLHPDIHGEDISSEFRVKLTAVFSRVVESYKVLSDVDKRRQYDSALAGGDLRMRVGTRARPKAPEEQIKDAKARRFFQLGLAALHDKNGQTAITNFRLALSMEPDSELIKSKIAEAEALVACR
jgi:curved DNA-binding protein CbpA